MTQLTPGCHPLPRTGTRQQLAGKLGKRSPITESRWDVWRPSNSARPTARDRQSHPGPSASGGKAVIVQTELRIMSTTSSGSIGITLYFALVWTVEMFSVFLKIFPSRYASGCDLFIRCARWRAGRRTAKMTISSLGNKP